ncbi:hypothetical protein CBR_g51075 [Chara braunii]|uniref:Uncharacterized protein n=1 Tax=Chara braunii TaxID=69332 RepID=A0A388K5Z8_CHABU|nr:hypothetical protein CBR_g51075 [Chara braunii]|eukprot:GBG65480.1 hypothetical protein CBR_g51075 [Chara braunii]
MTGWQFNSGLCDVQAVFTRTEGQRRPPADIDVVNFKDITLSEQAGRQFDSQMYHRIHVYSHRSDGQDQDQDPEQQHELSAGANSRPGAELGSMIAMLGPWSAGGGGAIRLIALPGPLIAAPGPLIAVPGSLKAAPSPLIALAAVPGPLIAAPGAVIAVPGPVIAVLIAPGPLLAAPGPLLAAPGGSTAGGVGGIRPRPCRPTPRGVALSESSCSSPSCFFCCRPQNHNERDQSSRNKSKSRIRTREQDQDREQNHSSSRRGERQGGGGGAVVSFASFAAIRPVLEKRDQLVAAVGWNSSNELYSCSDDRTVHKWNMNGEAMGKACEIDSYYTDMHWYPSGSKRQQSGPGTDVFVVSCTDGSFRIIAKNGREEKRVDAHKGAVIALRWNYEGTALASAGEDGMVKVWSRSGMLRSTLAQTENTVYSVAWSSDSDQLLFSTGRDLVIKPLQPSSKQMQWKAHEGPVLKVDWNPVNHLIVSGGEDCLYKVWDIYGRLLYQSAPADYGITAVTWCPNGELFAVGSFNALILCDKTGWTYSRHKPNSGSLSNIAWTLDGTQLAAAGGNGSLVFGQLIGRKIEWKRITATIEDTNRILIQDVLTETVEELDFRDRVIKASLGCDHLVVATATQCCIFSTSNWNTPHIFDIKDTVLMILQSQRHFLMIDSFSGLQLFTYEGRQVCNPRFQGLRTEFLNEQSVSLANEILAVIDTSDYKSIRLFDTSMGKFLGEHLSHSMEIVEIAVNQTGSLVDKKLVFIDRNRDLYITPVLKPALVKLTTMVDSAAWNDGTDMLAAMADQKMVVWYYPNVVYVDNDLLPRTKYTKDGSELGKLARIVSFFGCRCVIRRIDGALVTVSVSPYPLILYEQVHANRWEQATRLCRSVKDNSLWACLAAIAINAKQLDAAEAAFAAIDEIDRLQFVIHIKDIPSEEGRNAELALFARRPEEAESILLQAGLTYRAIQMNIRLYNWDRALELAVNYKTHIDTVLLRRAQYLNRIQRAESNPRFLQYMQHVTVDEDKVKLKVEAEKEKERRRSAVLGGHRAGGGGGAAGYPPPSPG